MFLATGSEHACFGHEVRGVPLVMSRSHPERPDSATVDRWLAAGTILRQEPDEKKRREEDEEEEDGKKDDDDEDETDDGWSE